MESCVIFMALHTTEIFSKQHGIIQEINRISDVNIMRNIIK